MLIFAAGKNTNQCIMKKNIIKSGCVALGLSLCVLAACSSQEETMSANQPFVLASSIQGVSLSRAPQLDASGKGRFTDGDVNTLFFMGKDGRFIKDFSYTYGHTYYWNDVQLNEAGQELKVSACYPAVEASDPADFSWDVTGQSTATADFLIAAPATVQEGCTTQVPLQFIHLMHKFIVQLHADGITVMQDDLSEAQVTMAGFLPQARMNLLTAAVLGADGPSAELHAQGAEAHFILPPQAVDGMEVKISVSGRIQHFRLSELKAGDSPLTTLESGKAFTLAVKVSKSSFSIIGQGIGPWGSQGEANGEIIL